jgi:choline/glycine/proline betaine transport protein
VLTTGAGVALLAFSVGQPLSMSYGSFYFTPGYRSQDKLHMMAINLSALDWGLASWARYATVGVAISLAVHRFSLPMCCRSGFYPLLGAYTFGWMGDIIDGLTIFATVVTVFSSLGLGAIQIVTGIKYMGWIDSNTTQAHANAIETTTVWVIVLVSIGSVINGLHGGTPFLAGFALFIASILMCLVFVMDDTKFLLNLQVQEVGYYFQTSIFQLNFWTDAFGQIPAGSGRAVDGRAAEPWWMEAWLNLSQAFW